MEMWAVDNRERLSSAGNLWETVLSRVTKQNQAREEAKKPGQSGISEPLLPLSASLFMTEITSHHTGVWTRHGSYMLEKSGSILVECMDGRLSTSMIKHPSMAFHNLESWGLDHLLSCTSYFPTTFIFDFNPPHYLILPACSLLLLPIPVFTFFQIYSYMWWLFLTKSWAYPQSLGETRLV